MEGRGLQYRRRRQEKTVLYRTVQENLGTLQEAAASWTGPGCRNAPFEVDVFA
jgi:hypothetical protein